MADFGRHLVCSLGVILGLVFTLSVRAQQASTPQFPYMDPALPLDQRVDDLIGRMTLEEKVSQMRDHAVAIPRLGVPKYDWWNEGLHGVAFAGYATNFPQVIGMAATWDTNLVRQMGETISIEARAKYNEAMRQNQHEAFFGLTFWAPNINIFRDPRWGRVQETYGEDPYLTGRMAVAFVSGMQGGDPHYLRVVSTPKHFAVHSGPEPTRHTFNVDVSPHDLEDTYLPAFRAAVTQAHAQSVMCAKGYETPLRELAGFKRVHLEAGECAHVSLTIDPRVLGQVGEEGNRVILPGEYTVSLGGAQPQETGSVETAKFNVTGKTKLPK